MQVISDQAEAVVSLITGIHIDPETGDVIALQCGFNQVISPIDIVKWERAVHINDQDALTPPEDILRLQSLARKGDQILYKPVVTERGEKVGRAYDFVIDTKAMTLWQIVVREKFLFFTTFETVINRSHVVEILEDKIVVKELLAMEKGVGLEPEVAA